MTKDKKQTVVSFLSNELKESNALVVADYKGLNHKTIEELRIAAKSSDSKVMVTKNTLAKLAIESAYGIKMSLADENIFVWSKDQITACKISNNFAKNNSENFKIRCGVIENELADDVKVKQFASLPSKEELLGMLLSVWSAPIRNFTTGLFNLAEKKGASSDTK